MIWDRCVQFVLTAQNICYLFGGGFVVKGEFDWNRIEQIVSTWIFRVLTGSSAGAQTVHGANHTQDIVNDFLGRVDMLMSADVLYQSCSYLC
jgi:hypothetical protein